MTTLRRRYIPSLEALEDRLNPAGGTVTGSFAAGVWTLTGDGFDNNITINSTGTPGRFTVSGMGTAVVGVTNPIKVQSVVIDFQDGTDTVAFNNNSTPIKLAGALTINGGNGDSHVFANALTVAKRVAITNLTGHDEIFLTGFRAKASVGISNGDGGSEISIDTSVGFGFNLVAGNLKITSTFGADNVSVADTNVLGNVIVNCGSGNGTVAGNFGFYNVNQTTTRALIGGSLNVTFLDGDTSALIADATVRGSATLNTGSGHAVVNADGYHVSQQVLIVGNLTINCTGPTQIIVGDYQLHTGLKVQGNFTVNLGAPAEFLRLFKLTVVGATNIH